MNFHTTFLREIMYDEKSAQELDMHMSRLQKAKGEMTSQILANQDFDADDDANDESNLYDTLAVTLGNKKKWRHSGRYFASVNRVYYAMVTSIAILICGVIFLYCFSTLTFLNNQTVDMGAILDARRIQQELVYDTRQLELIMTYGPQYSDKSEETLRREITESSHALSECLRQARTDNRYNNDEKLERDWTGSIVPIITRTSRGQRIEKVLDTATLFDLVSGNGAALAVLNVTTMKSNESEYARGAVHRLNSSAHWSMIMDNAPITLSRFTNEIVWDTARAHRETVYIDQMVLVSLMAVVATVPLLLTIFVVVPSFVLVKKERRFVFSLLRRMPEEVLNELYAKHKAIASTLKNDGDDKNSMYTSSTGGSASNIELGMNSDISAMYYLSRFSNAPSWIRMIFIYSVSILMLMTVLFTSVLMAYDASVSLSRTSGEIGRASDRAGDIAEIMTLSQEWIRGDDYIWPDKTILKTALGEQIDKVRPIINNILMSG